MDSSVNQQQDYRKLFTVNINKLVRIITANQIIHDFLRMFYELLRSVNDAQRIVKCGFRAFNE